jgi:hypothetical protein
VALVREDLMAIGKKEKANMAFRTTMAPVREDLMAIGKKEKANMAFRTTMAPVRENLMVIGEKEKASMAAIPTMAMAHTTLSGRKKNIICYAKNMKNAMETGKQWYLSLKIDSLGNCNFITNG